MKKILLVGYVPYGYTEKLQKKYPNIIWFEERKIYFGDSAFAFIEVVGMMDGVMFMKDSLLDRKAYEVVCTLQKKDMYELDAFPVEEEE